MTETLKKSSKFSKKRSNKSPVDTSEAYVREQMSLYGSLNPDDTNALMLPRKKKTAPEKKTPQKNTMTKSEARKLKQLMKKKKLNAEKAELMNTLKDTQLSVEDLQLLKPVHSNRLTRNELMKKAELFLKKGIQIDENDKEFKRVIQRVKEKYATGVEDVDWSSVFPEVGQSIEVPEGITTEAQIEDQVKSTPSVEPVATPEVHPKDNKAIDLSVSKDIEMLSQQNEIKPSSVEESKESITETTLKQQLNPTSTSSFITLDFFGTTNKKEIDTNSESSADTTSGEDEDFDDDILLDRASFHKIRQHEAKTVTPSEFSSGDENPQSSQKRKRDADVISNQPRKTRKFWIEKATDHISEFESMIRSKVDDDELKVSLLNSLNQLRDVIINEDVMVDIEEVNTQALMNQTKKPGYFLKEIKKNLHDDKDVVQKLLEKQTASEKSIETKRFYVPVSRDPKIQESRLMLPVCSEEQEIMEKILENDVVIICGETGSGKTTQVPQFLYEYGFGDERSGYPGLIGVTQPRRIAAISTAKRVAEELNVPFGSKVSYHVRYDNNLSQETQLKFMTDGILLKETQSDFLLSEYSALLIDEAHERNVNTDILIGFLSRIIPERNKRARLGEVMPNGKKIAPLKLLIMSATLRVDDFTKNPFLFPPDRIPVVINIQSRQFPVHVHFSKHTAFFNYVGASVKKAVKVHEKCPPGGILIFLTGKQEIDHCVKKLREYSEKKQIKEDSKPEEITETNSHPDEEEAINELGNLSSDDEFDDVDNDSEEEYDPTNFPDATVEDSHLESNDSNKEEAKPKETVTLFEDNIKDQSLIDEGNQVIKKLNRSKKCPKLYVLPLYSMLHPKEQLKVFQPPPPGYRLCVVATNVAETSLTIPNIRYVIDPGRVKEREFDNLGVSKMVVQWTSQAGANQRAGRAGRTGPGHVYRLYSSAVFKDRFKPFFDPEIVKTPIDNIVLQMKTMGIGNIESFPLPTPPPVEALKKATRTLVQLRALKLKENSRFSDPILETSITSLGKKMAEFPLDPKLSKMLIMAKKTPVLPHIIAIVSALSVEFLLMHSSAISDIYDKYKVGDGPVTKKPKLTNEDEELKDVILASKKLFSDPFSDHLSLLKVVGAYQHSNTSENFCEEHYIHLKNMKEVYKLALQLTNTVLKQMPNVNLKLHKKTKVVKLSPPNQIQEVQIRQIICGSCINQIARKVVTEEELNNLSHEGRLTERNRPYITLALGPNIPVYIHPFSNLHSINPKFIVYSELIQTEKGRYYMRGVSAVEESWLHTYGGSLVQFSKPLSEPLPFYNQEKDSLHCYVQPFFGENGEWKLSFKKQKYPHKSTEEIDAYYNWFASLFIQGKIFEDLPSRSEMLHSTKELRQGHIVSKRAIQLVETLRRACVKEKEIIPSKTLIKLLWQQDKTFLLLEYLYFVKEAHREAIASQWPPKK